MRTAHTVAEVRTAEEVAMARVPEGALMQRAAAGLAAAVAAYLGRSYGARVLLVIGAGNNGGDALYAGAHLARRGAVVEAVLLAPDRVHTGGLSALIAAGGREVSPSDATEPDVVIDGIVGIGGQGPLRPAAAELTRRFAASPWVAVDLPSGVEADTGEISGDHVQAALTVTFGTHKVANLVDPGAAACGAVELVDIGLDLPDAAVASLQATDVAELLPWPTGTDHKFSRGVVGLRTGSERYQGAALLSVLGAQHATSGLVRYAGPATELVRAHAPEVVMGEGRVQAWVVGCGSDDRAAADLAACLADDVPVVIDADAVAALRSQPPSDPGRVVLTPHAGELGRLLEVPREEVEAAPLRHARTAAEQLGSVVLLKGRRTLVARPDGHVLVNPTGTPWLATAGAGDVLAGLIGALLASGVEPASAAAVGAWLHGAAATLAGGPVLAAQVAARVPEVVSAISR